MVLQIPAGTSAPESIPTVPFLSPLPAFLRLRKKLGWKISELDYALLAFGYVNSPTAASVFAKSAQFVSHPTGGGTGPVADQNDRAPIFIPADVIPIAAQIQQLTETLNLSVSDVVSLWADIDKGSASCPFQRSSVSAQPIKARAWQRPLLWPIG
jgi:hypothetical protein